MYQAQPPTKGAPYSDGQNNRYLLGGTWLYRADQSNVGLSQGWWQNVASTDGWSPVTTPNSYNAGDFSQATMNGYVGWYRRDFTVPANAFARYVPNGSRQWIVRFESVNYRATVWLSGHQIGTHTGAFLPFEFDLPCHAVKVVGRQLELNGRKLHLGGVFMHEQALNDGAAITVAQHGAASPCISSRPRRWRSAASSRTPSRSSSRTS